MTCNRSQNAGPWHFMVNDPSRVNGSSARRRRVLRRRGILETSVPSDVWEQWLSSQMVEKVRALRVERACALKNGEGVVKKVQWLRSQRVRKVLM